MQKKRRRDGRGWRRAAHRNLFVLTWVLLLSANALPSLSCSRGGVGTADTGTADVGTADAEAAEQNLPDCLRDLFAPCSETGACRGGQNDAAGSHVSCFDSGVRSEDTSTFGNAPQPICTGRHERKVFKPDGQLCYAYELVEVSPSTICGESQTATWWDAVGHLIASASVHIAGATVTCAAGGETFTCMFQRCHRNLGLFSGNCLPGTCP